MPSDIEREHADATAKAQEAFHRPSPDPERAKAEAEAALEANRRLAAAKIADPSWRYR